MVPNGAAGGRYREVSLHSRRVCRVAQSLVAWRAPGVTTGHRRRRATPTGGIEDCWDGHRISSQSHNGQSPPPYQCSRTPRTAARRDPRARFIRAKRKRAARQLDARSSSLASVSALASDALACSRMRSPRPSGACGLTQSVVEHVSGHLSVEGLMHEDLARTRHLYHSVQRRLYHLVRQQVKVERRAATSTVSLKRTRAARATALVLSSGCTASDGSRVPAVYSTTLRRCELYRGRWRRARAPSRELFRSRSSS